MHIQVEPSGRRINLIITEGRSQTFHEFTLPEGRELARDLLEITKVRMVENLEIDNG